MEFIEAVLMRHYRAFAAEIKRNRQIGRKRRAPFHLVVGVFVIGHCFSEIQRCQTTTRAAAFVDSRWLLRLFRSSDHDCNAAGPPTWRLVRRPTAHLLIVVLLACDRGVNGLDNWSRVAHKNYGRRSSSLNLFTISREVGATEAVPMCGSLRVSFL